MNTLAPLSDESKSVPAPASGFIHRRSHDVESLNLTIHEYEHQGTGTLHFHLDTDNDENVFLVALRTVPTDSTGVAHILEHTALCGSKRYPVRDPFFMMIRRSLNTFMNAFTSSDWTAYPFASQNRKDYFNLLDVYLDAVFFSNLNELDFAQEGHRLEFSNPDDTDSELLYKGVVFNEMKGAMSSPISTLWQTLSKYLFPTTTYHFNSGGEPEDIPDLSYAQLKSFYETHYHPSNAVFMTYGNIPAAELQVQFEDRVLKHFQHSQKQIHVNNEKRYLAPVNIEEFYALDEEENTGDKTHIVLSWLLGPTTDLRSSLTAELLSGVLLDDSASPLRQALETSDLGSAPSPLCGLENSHKEMTFACGMEGSKPEHAQAVQELVTSTLKRVVKNGVPRERVEAVLHQLELQQREVGGNHYPYGLQLILDALPAAVHYADPLTILDLEPALEQLRADIQNADFIPQLIQEFLLDNSHRVRLTLIPDTQLSQRSALAETARLALIKNQLSENEKTNIIELSHKLKERQQQEDDESILPKVGLDDVPEKMHIAKGSITTNKGRNLHLYQAGTNGIVYQQLVATLPMLDNELLNILPYYTNCLTELGCKDQDYLAMQAIQSSVSGGISAFTSIRSAIDNVQTVNGHFILSSKALARNQHDFGKLIKDIFEGTRFDEHDRIRELMAQLRAGREQSITGNGHVLAMRAASAGMSPSAALKHRLSGLSGISQLKKLDDNLDERTTLERLSEDMASIHAAIQQSPNQLLLIGEKESLSSLQQTYHELWNDLITSVHHPFTLPETRQTVKELWTTSTSVNFCAKAYPTVPAEHPDAPALTVLGGFLRNGFLHTSIREQGGAYGGGASHDTDAGCFCFYSYRDPRLVETLQDFDRSIDWLLSEKHEWRQVEEAILGVISSLDKPSSPAGEAKDAFHSALYGRTPEKRQAFRQRILSTTLEDLQRVGENYLKPELASTAVITGSQHADSASELGLELRKL